MRRWSVMDEAARFVARSIEASAIEMRAFGEPGGPERPAVSPDERRRRRAAGKRARAARRTSRRSR